jgi:PAS domain S-box-containing protein
MIASNVTLPLAYLLLIVIWSVVLVFCLIRLKQGRLRARLFSIILIVFAIEAFRTLFESAFFGIMLSSQFGILPGGIFSFLSAPYLMAIPKILNVLAAVIILALLLWYWIPSESQFLTDQRSQRREIEESKIRVKRSEERLLAEQAFRESEQRMGAILRAAPIGITVCEPDGRFVMVSDDFQGALGYTEEELQSLRFIDITHPDDRADTEASTAKVIAGESDGYEFEKRYLKKDGSVLWGHVRVAAVRDPDGILRNWIGLIEDITEKKKYQEQMVRLVHAIESTSDGIGITDQEGNAIYMNRAMHALIGYNIDELNAAGGPPTLYTDKNKAEEAVKSAFSGVAWKGEMELISKSGRLTPVEADAAPIFNDNGQVIGVIGVHRDISERKLAEKTLRAQQVFMQQVLDLSPNFIYIHDLVERNNIFMSGQGVKELGLSDDDFTRAGSDLFMSLIHPDDLENLENHVKLMLQAQDGAVLDVEYRIKDIHGNWRWLRSRDSVFKRDKSGGMRQVIGFAEDITARKQAETERKEAYKALAESEEKFRAAFEYAAVGRAIAHPDGPFIQVNEAFASILGMTRDEMLERTWQDITHPDDIPIAYELLRRLVDQEAPGVKAEMRQIRKDGGIVWVRLSGVLIRDDADQPLYLVGDIEDISRRMEYEDRLRKYERIVSTSQDLMSLINRDYVFEAVSDSYQRYHGLSSDDIVGKPAPDLMGAEVFRKKIEPHLVRALAGESDRFQDWFDFPNLGPRFMSVSYNPIFNEDGRVEGVVAHSRDVTDTKRLEEQLIQSQKMESVGTLAGGIAHDFNNILGVIMGQAGLMEMLHAKNNPGLQKGLGEVLSATNRAKELVQQILSFSRRSDRDRKAMDMAPVVKETIKFLRSTIPTTIEIQSKVPSSGCVIVGHPTDINQILMNLGTNASHAMRDRGGTLEVHMDRIFLDDTSARQYVDLEPGDYVTLTVSDTGGGIDPGIRDRIFEPYFTTKEHGEGTGFGLAVVHGIVRSLSGTIAVYSEPGQGTTFRLLIPCAAAAAVEVGESGEKRIQGGNERVLLVDDESALLNTACRMLENLGYKVTAVDSALNALELFTSAPEDFDVVVTDLTMPKMNGFELSKQILKIRPKAPIVLCTGFSRTITRQTAKAAGIKEYLNKPLSMDELARTVREAIDSPL